jgi:hypothetical protein
MQYLSIDIVVKSRRKVPRATKSMTLSERPVDPGTTFLTFILVTFVPNVGKSNLGICGVGDIWKREALTQWLGVRVERSQLRTVERKRLLASLDWPHDLEPTQ